MKAALHCGEILLPGAEAVVELLPLLLAKGAMCTVAAKHNPNMFINEVKLIEFTSLILSLTSS